MKLPNLLVGHKRSRVANCVDNVRAPGKYAPSSSTAL